jgi:fructose-bisphosphate aldolase class II
MLVNNLELQNKAKSGGYAVGAFNTNNLEITKSILDAVKETQSPVMFAVSPSAMEYAGAENLAALVRIASDEIPLIPVSLHLDHGLTIEDVMIALRSGFSSVMIDGSKKPYEENIALTKQVVELAHSIGVSVEAELGKLVGVEDRVTVTEKEAAMTNPDEANDFVKRTGVDTLAVAIGNAHGWYKGKPDLDFDRLKEIREAVDIPLVLHGASGIPGEDIKKAISIGITKINIDTEIRDAFKRGVSSFISENPEIFDPRKILKPAMKNMTEIVKTKIDLFGSKGKA